MPARQTPRHNRRCPELRQFDLFDAARKVAHWGPEWKALPEATRQEAMTALTRLMLNHGRQRGLQGREARHDD